MASNTGAVLDTHADGKNRLILNRGANSLNIYPDSGIAIESGAANAAVIIVVGGASNFIYSSASGVWRAY